MEIAQLLSESGVEFEMVMHEQAFTAQRVAEVEHVSGHRFAKTVIARSPDGKFFMFVLPAPKHVDFEKASEIVGQELKMATEPEMKKLFLDCQVGAEPPFGSVYNVPTYMDEHLLDVEKLIFRCGSHDKTLQMSLRDFLNVEDPKIAEFCIEGD